MAEKIITVKEAEEESKGDNRWIKLTDNEDKVHRVFASVQSNDGQWIHFEDKFEMLLGSKGKALRLTKEKKGNFWNVIGVELVENIFVAEAQKQVEDEEIKRQYRRSALLAAKDLAVADKIKYGQIISTAELFNQYLVGNITIPEELIIKYVQEQVKAELSKKGGLN